MAIIQDPMAVFAICALVCGLVFWAGRVAIFQKLFRVIPSIVFVYYVPAILSTLGVLPTDSAAYDWMRDYLLPFSLFILMFTADIPAIMQIGPRAIAMMLAGTVGVVVGGPIALLLLGNYLPPDAWKGLAALSGSWIGGGGNFAALKEAVGAPDTIIGPIIVVDTAVGYTWMGILLIGVNFVDRFDRWNGASAGWVEDLNRRLREWKEQGRRTVQLDDITGLLAVGFLGAVLFKVCGDLFYSATSDYMSSHLPGLASIFSPFTWMVILLTTAGIGLSFTRLREMERAGASQFGYAALYLFLTSIGAGADLAGLAAAPALLLAGVIWICVHIIFLLVAARLLRSPLFLVAVGSQANIGGAASAPIVAAAYYEAMAPVGLMMGILGYLVGNYAGLLCAYLLQMVA